MAIDLSSDVGRVRLLISDVDENAPTFSDDEVDAFLDLEDGDVRLAAAQALDALASNEALVSKRIRTLDLSTDGPAVAAELRARATSLRAQVESCGEFDIADGGCTIAELAEPRLP